MRIYTLATILIVGGLWVAPEIIVARDRLVQIAEMLRRLG